MKKTISILVMSLSTLCFAKVVNSDYRAVLELIEAHATPTTTATIDTSNFRLIYAGKNASRQNVLAAVNAPKTLVSSGTAVQFFNAGRKNAELEKWLDPVLPASEGVTENTPQFINFGPGSVK